MRVRRNPSGIVRSCVRRSASSEQSMATQQTITLLRRSSKRSAATNFQKLATKTVFLWLFASFIPNDAHWLLLRFATSFWLAVFDAERSRETGWKFHLTLECTCTVHVLYAHVNVRHKKVILWKRGSVTMITPTGLLEIQRQYRTPHEQIRYPSLRWPVVPAHVLTVEKVFFLSNSSPFLQCYPVAQQNTFTWNKRLTVGEVLVFIDTCSRMFSNMTLATLTNKSRFASLRCFASDARSLDSLQFLRHSQWWTLPVRALTQTMRGNVTS